MKSSLYAVLLASVIVLISSIVSAKVKTGTGTLIILNASKDEIVVAADSRLHKEYLHKDEDDHCKIDAFGNELIFAAAGTTTYENDKGVVWDAHTIARDNFDRLSKKTDTEPLLVRLAQAWEKEVNNKLRRDLAEDPGDTAPLGLGREVISAIFAGFDKNSPFIIRVGITFGGFKNGQPITTPSFDPYAGPTSPVNLRPLGISEVANELFADRTDRAQKWQHDIRARIPKGGDPLAFMAIEAIRFSIENQIPSPDGVKPLGGPIDAVRLDRTGIHWIRHKKNCRIN